MQLTAKQVLLDGMSLSTKMMGDFLSDLDDADLLTRPVEGANHVAWQLGHLITAEHRLMSGIGVAMPELPDGFAHKHNKIAAANDNPADFLTKSQYIALYDEQRAASRLGLENYDEAKLTDPVPERGFPPFLKKIADVFYLLAAHQTLHSGQFTATRRKLGKPRLF